MFSAWNGVSLLVVSLSLCNSAPAPWDCESTVTPLTLDNPPKISGRWHFIEGFSDNDLYISMMKTVDSAWIDITASLEDNSTFTMMEYSRINGTCVREQAKITLISDNIVDITYHDEDVGANYRGTWLSTCVNCMLFNFTTSVSGVDNPIHSLHLLAREQTLKESDLQMFHQQAKCLNFSMPASFHSNQDQEFCAEDNMTAPPTTPQNCESLVTPLTLDNPAKISGRWNFIEGVSDHDLFDSIMKTVDSAWIDITASPEDNSTFTMMEYNRINGTCFREQAKITVISDTIMDIKHNDKGDTHVGDTNRGTLLSTCVNCLLFNFTTSVSLVDTPIHSLHLLAREQTLTESDLQAFHQQVKCLNFSMPASFHSNQDQEFCAEDNMTVAVEKVEENV